VIEVAFAQSSFGGACSVTQISNLPKLVGTAEVEYTLIKYCTPALRPLAFNTPVALQPLSVRVPHGPPNNCIWGFVKFVLLLIVIFGLEIVVVNLYQTSYTGAPQLGAGIPPVKVEPTTLPEVFVHAPIPPEVNAMAPAQSLLVIAASVTHIVYPQVPPAGATVWVNILI